MRRSSTTTIALLLITAGLALSIFYKGKRPSEPDPAAVVAQVQQLSELATVRFTIQKVVGLKEQKQPLGYESILLVMQANVDAGIDLAGLSSRDLTMGPNGAMVVRLPPAKIINVSVDEKQTKVWDREKTWWTPWVPYSLDLEQKARVAGIDAVKQAALGMGILKQAERNAGASIKALLQLSGLKSVQVIPASTS